MRGFVEHSYRLSRQKYLERNRELAVWRCISHLALRKSCLKTKLLHFAFLELTLLNGTCGPSVDLTPVVPPLIRVISWA